MGLHVPGRAAGQVRLDAAAQLACRRDSAPPGARARRRPRHRTTSRPGREWRPPGFSCEDPRCRVPSVRPPQELMRRTLLVLGFVLLAVGVPQAQLRGVKATLTPLVAQASAHPGDRVRLALVVTLPPEFHVQSNAPRDPTLIATVLTVEPAPGRASRRGRLSRPRRLQDGRRRAAARRVSPRVRARRRDRAAGEGYAGPLQIPGQLRYQACNDRLCFAPSTVPVSWTVDVVARDAGAREEREPSGVWRDRFRPWHPSGGASGDDDAPAPPLTGRRICASSMTSRWPGRRAAISARRSFCRSCGTPNEACARKAGSRAAARSPSCSWSSWAASRSTSRRACCR